jgi:hypothetical protein
MDPETWKNLYYGSFAGLPVYTSKWMPDTMIVMGNRFGKTQAMDLAFNPADRTYRFGGEVITEQAMETLMANRPYSKLTSSQLAQTLSDQLSGATRAPLDATAFGETNRTYLASSVMSSTSNVETVFRVGADGRPEAVTRLVEAPSKSSVRNAGESELAWLRRRVDEICWRPT